MKRFISYLLFSDTMNYEEMLQRGKKNLPEITTTSERFVVPKVTGHIEGNKTVISNFFQIASTIGRPPEHLLKFISRETAAKGEIKKQLLIFNTKLSSSKINEKIEQYVEQFVICKECGKPDTKLSKEGIVTFIRCQACGAKSVVNSKI
ncbi:MAG: translation initiation factor IF-2 subunit beta [Candidatus Woesearchaeota archaeon]|nr:MAG: translation initiation factor IF-2 subunit beta [Candidatus Woesearchaeota archaeon]